MSLINFLDRGCQINSDGDYLVFGNNSHTYRKAREFTCQVANALLAEGCGKEAKAAVWSANNPVGWLCTLSIWRAGMAWVPINYRNAIEENQYVLDAFDCEVLFFQATFAPQVASIRTSLPGVRLYISIDDKKDMIITGGFNVFSAEVEGVINSHPAVQDCAVVGVPDDKWGEAVKAVVELNPASSVDAAELIALCKERLGSVKAPQSVDFVTRLPRSSVGKVLKREVREPFWHPIGATGIGQIFELVTQLRGEAGKRQVEGARVAIQENGGGLFGVEEGSAHIGIFSRN